MKAILRIGWSGALATAAALAALSLLPAPPAQAAPPLTIAGPGSAAGQVNIPKGTAVDQSNGDLYVADDGNVRVDKFDAEGNFLLAWGFAVADDESAVLQTCGPQASPPTTKCFAASSSELFQNPGAGNIRPESVAVDQSSHDVYVADGDKRRVTKFGPDGEFIFMVGKGVDQGGGSPAHPGNLCTAEYLGNGDTCGAGQNGAGAGEFFTSPGAVVVDASSNIWVLDGSRIDQFDSAGNFLSQVSISGGTGAQSLVRDSVGDFYTVRSGTNEKQEVSLSGFAQGDTFRLANLPTPCSVSSTAPITFHHGIFEDQASIEEALREACGGDDFWVFANSVFSNSIGFVGRLATQNAAPLTCAKLTGAGSCSIATVVNGAPGTVEKLDSSGALLKTIYSGGPEALALDSAGNLYVGDERNYHFLKFSPAGELISLFGTGQVLVNHFGGGPRGNALALDEVHKDLYAANGRSAKEEGGAAVQRFAFPAEGPLPEGLRAEDLLPTTATLAASLNPEGHATEYHFEYVTQQGYEEQGNSFAGPATVKTPAAALSGSEYEAEDISAGIEHLIPATAYRFRIVATNSKGTVEEEASFTTRPAVAIDAQWSSDVAAGSATFKAELDPLGVPAKWWLEYGTDKSYGTGTEHLDLGSGFGDVTVAKQIAGLDPDTLYHYRFVAEDERDGVKYPVEGPDQTVLTAIGALGFELPDGRAWEQVTPLHKGGGLIVPPSTGFTQASPNGSALTFLSVGPVSPTEGSRAPEPAQSLARLGPSGWSSEQIDPPQETARGISGQAQYQRFSTDLSRAAVEVLGLRAKEPGPLSAGASERTPYLRENLLDPVRWRPLLSGCPLPPDPCAPAVEAAADVPPGTEFGGEAEEQLHGHPAPLVVVLGGSPELNTAILQSRVPLTEDAIKEKVTGALYEWSAEAPPAEALRLVSLLPEGAGGKAVGGAALGSIGTLSRGSSDHAISTAGRYVYWHTGADSPTALYVRDTVAGETARLDVAQPGSVGGATAPFFQDASADGRHAFFTDTHHLTPNAGETGADLYECELVQTAGKDECVLRDLTPETEDREAADVQGIVSGIGESGQDVYFVANGALAPGASPGDCTPTPTPGATCSLYHAHREGESWQLGFVATLASEDQPDWGTQEGRRSSAFRVAAASPSGRYLAFMSDRPLSGYDSRDAASGEADEEVFRYDSATDTLACVSCNPSGARPRGVREGVDAFRPPSDWGPEFPRWAGRWLAATLPDPEHQGEASAAGYRPRTMLDNGRVLFNAFDGLVPADSNGTSDAYQYEPWLEGSCTPSSKGPAASQAQGGACVALLSSGTSELESGVIDSSATGEDVFLVTASQLSPLDEDPDYDIYDVRVGGVGATREESPECLGEACQSPAPAPGAPTPPTAALAGDGNLTPSAPKPRCPKGKRKVRGGGKAHCVKHQRHRHGRAHR